MEEVVTISEMRRQIRIIREGHRKEVGRLLARIEELKYSGGTRYERPERLSR